MYFRGLKTPAPLKPAAFALFGVGASYFRGLKTPAPLKLLLRRGPRYPSRYFRGLKTPAPLKLVVPALRFALEAVFPGS